MPRKGGKGRSGKGGRGRRKQQSNTGGDSRSNANASQPSKKKGSSANANAGGIAEVEPNVFVGLDIGNSYLKIATVQVTKQGSNPSKQSSDPHNVPLKQMIAQLSSAENSHNQLLSRIKVTAFDTGEHLIPNVVTVLHDGKESLIGGEAVASSIRNAKKCVYHPKYLFQIAHSTDDPDSIQKEYSQWKKMASQFGMQGAVAPLQLADDEQSDESESKQESVQNKSILQYRIAMDDDPSEFVSFQFDHALRIVLTKLFQVISLQTSSSKIFAVVSVPSHYGAAQIDPLSATLTKAGFKTLQFISDHSAAMLAYGITDIAVNPEPSPPAQNVLVLDFKTWHSSLSILHSYNGMTQRVYSKRSNEISGMAIDNLLLKFTLKDFERKNRMFIEVENRRARLKLRKEITSVKHVLSGDTNNEATFYIESLFEGIDYHSKLSKARYEMVIYDVVRAIPLWINQCIEEFKAPIHKVLLSGGLAQIPKIRQVLRDLFGDKLLDWTSVCGEAQFVNVTGCAIQASLLQSLHRCNADFFSTANNEALAKSLDVNAVANEWKLSYSLSSDASNTKENLCVVAKDTCLPFETRVAVPANVTTDDDMVSVLIYCESDGVDKSGELQCKLSKQNNLEFVVSMDENEIEVRAVKNKKNSVKFDIGKASEEEEDLDEEDSDEEEEKQ